MGKYQTWPVLHLFDGTQTDHTLYTRPIPVTRNTKLPPPLETGTGAVVSQAQIYTALGAARAAEGAHTIHNELTRHAVTQRPL